MSFDRPGLPHPGHELRPEVDETLAEEGVELDHHDHAPDVPDHPGDRSSGPQPNPPRRPSHDSAAEAQAETQAETPAEETPAEAVPEGPAEG